MLRHWMLGFGWNVLLQSDSYYQLERYDAYKQQFPGASWQLRGYILFLKEVHIQLNVQVIKM